MFSIYSSSLALFCLVVGFQLTVVGSAESSSLFELCQDLNEQLAPFSRADQRDAAYELILKGIKAKGTFMRPSRGRLYDALKTFVDYPTTEVGDACKMLETIYECNPVVHKNMQENVLADTKRYAVKCASSGTLGSKFSNTMREMYYKDRLTIESFLDSDLIHDYQRQNPTEGSFFFKLDDGASDCCQPERATKAIVNKLAIDVDVYNREKGVAYLRQHPEEISGRLKTKIKDSCSKFMKHFNDSMAFALWLDNLVGYNKPRLEPLFKNLLWQPIFSYQFCRPLREDSAIEKLAGVVTEHIKSRQI